MVVQALRVHRPGYPLTHHPPSQPFWPSVSVCVFVCPSSLVSLHVMLPLDCYCAFAMRRTNIKPTKPLKSTQSFV